MKAGRTLSSTLGAGQAHAKAAVQRLLWRLGYTLVRTDRVPDDFDPLQVEIVTRVRPYTMTSPERLAANIDAIRHIEHNDVPGAVVECGVWKGGSTMAMLLTLIDLGSTDREIYLYDTFEGMPPPTDADVARDGSTAADQLAASTSDSHVWAISHLDEVRNAIASTGHPSERVHFVRGKVEETIPGTMPDSVALLRLDTDWYESTLHELNHLYPRLSRGGVLISDDYGFWEGHRAAIDEYIDLNKLEILLARTDECGRICIKTTAHVPS